VWSDLPGRPLRLIVVDDDVRVIGWTDEVEVVLLRGQVTIPEALLNASR
jgi:hypothetical protein